MPVSKLQWNRSHIKNMSYTPIPFTPPIQQPVYTSSSSEVATTYYLPPVKVEPSPQYFPCRSEEEKFIKCLHRVIILINVLVG